MGKGSYEVFKDSGCQNKVWTVTYEKSQENATCSCRKWEFEGIVCRHIFSIFLRLCVRKFPEHYIIKRWTRTAKNGVICTANGNEIRPDLQKSITIRFNDLSYFSNRCAQLGALNERSYDFAKESLKKIIAGIDSINEEEAAKCADKEVMDPMIDMHETY